MTVPGALPPTPKKMLDEIDMLQAFLLQIPQTQIATEHLFHAGLYTRTIRMAPDLVLIGALMKRATVVIVAGHARVLAGENWIDLDGYNVLPASAGRKQVFVSVSEVFITMIFPTQATTVEEAESEFTDQAAELASRRDNVNRVVWTGE